MDDAGHVAHRFMRDDEVLDEFLRSTPDRVPVLDPLEARRLQHQTKVDAVPLLDDRYLR